MGPSLGSSQALPITVGPPGEVGGTSSQLRGRAMMLVMTLLNDWQWYLAGPDTYPMVQPASASMVQMQLRLCS